MIKNKQKIVVLCNADYLGTLDSARILGKNGVKVVVADPKKWRISNWSKYVIYVKSPDIKDTENFLKFLKEESKKGTFTTILPTSDIIVWYLASRYKDLSKYLEIPVFTPSVMKIVLFKNKFYRYCIRHGIDIPKTFLPTSIDEVKNVAKQVRYPVIIKHTTSVGMNSDKKGEIVHSEEELVRKYKKDELDYDKKLLLKEVPDIEWPMVQEYVPNALNNLYTVGGISVNNGNQISIISSMKIRQEPPKLGVGICIVPVNKPEVIKNVKKLLKTIKYNGIFGIEVLYDERDNKYKIIDFNPRVMGSIGVATGNGLPIQALWYDFACGEKNVKNRVFFGNRVMVHLISDILYLPGNIAHAPSKLKALKYLFKSYFGPKKFAVLSLDDPMPFVVDIIMTLRNKLKHPLFYLR